MMTGVRERMPPRSWLARILAAAGTAGAGLLLGLTVVRLGPAFALLGAGLVASVVLIDRPAAALVVVTAGAGLAGEFSIAAGVGGVSLLAFACVLAVRPSARNLRAVTRGQLWIPAVLVAFWAISAAAGGDIFSARHYVTRLVVFPLLLGVVAARVVKNDPGLSRTVAWPVWFTGIALSAAVVPFVDGRLAPLGALGSWSTYLIVGTAAAVRLADGRRRVLIVLLLPIAASVMVSGTRSSVLGAVVAAVLAARWTDDGNFRRRARRRIGSLVPALLMVGVVISPVGSNVVDRVVDPDIGTRRSTENRERLTETALGVAADHPVLGVGPGRFSERFPELRDEVGGAPVLDAGRDRVETHGFYTAVLAETGVLGFVLVTGTLVALVRTRLDPRCAWLRAALVGLLLAGVAQNIELHPSLSLTIGILLGASSAVGRGSPAEFRDDRGLASAKHRGESA